MSATSTLFMRDDVLNLSKNRSEPAWLREFRTEALETFQRLPLELSSLYTKYVDLGNVNLNSFNPLPAEKSTPLSSEELKLLTGEETAFTLIQSEGQTLLPELPQELTKLGVIFTDITTALNAHEDLVKAYILKKAIPPQDDKFAALNSAFFTKGALLYVPKGIEISTPFRTVNILNEPNASLFAQTTIVADAASKFTVIEENYTTSKESPPQAIHSGVTEVYLKPDSHVTFGSLQSFGGTVNVFANRRSIGEDKSLMSWAFGYLGGDLTRSRMDSVMRGTGASAELVELVFGNASQRLDLVSNLIHEGESTSGKSQTKGVLRERARAIFKGLIRIGKQAKNANAYLAEHAMLLSKEARSDAIPGLEIETNEVKATHAASVSQINEEQTFYMRTRGLSEDDAKKMQVIGFFEPIILKIPLYQVAKRIRGLIALKWDGVNISSPVETSKLPAFEEESEEQMMTARRRDIFEGHYKYR